MIDNSPWFRRWMGFSFVPINGKGWAAVGAVLLLETSLWLVPAEPESLLWWLLAAVGFATFLAFWALCIWKSEVS